MTLILTLYCCIYRHWLKISIALLVVMGITWLIGVAVFTEALLFVAYIFTIFVAFQVPSYQYNRNSCVCINCATLTVSRVGGFSITV